MERFWSEGSVSTLAGNGEPDFKDGRGTQASFNLPTGVAVELSGDVIVADNENHCIRRISTRGDVTVLAGTARAKGYRDGPGLQAAFFCPEGIAVTSEGTVHVADCANSRIRSISPQGEVSTLAGDGTADFKEGEKGCFNRPHGLALAPDGGLFVADWLNHRIRRVSPKGGVVTVAGSGEAGSKDGPAAEAAFSRPRRVATGPDGQLWVTNEDGRLCKIEGASQGNGRVSTVVAGLHTPSGLIVDCWGNVIVADSGKHQLLFCTSRGEVSVVAGNGQESFKDGSSEEASFKYPRGVALSPDGVVVVTDYGNHCVRALTLPSMKKLKAELLNLASSLPAGCAMSRSAGSLFKWVAVFSVREGPFYGGLFELTLEMPFNYPLGGPRIKFVTPIFHPNVDSDTGEVSVEWDETSNLTSALERVRALLVYPRLADRVVAIRNGEAKELFEKNQLAFESGAHEGARQSWLSKLKPGDAASLVCDLLVPCKKMSQEAQHELFKAMAEPEIEAHANKEYPPPVTIHLGKDPNSQKIYDLKEQARKQKIAALRGDLNLKLTETLLSLSDLQNPRAAVAEWLEGELSRLCVAEAKGDQGEGEPRPKLVRELLRTRPVTSKECFEMLVAEAEGEAKRLEEKMEACTAKFTFLYSRFERVQKIKPILGTPAQPLNGTHVLLAQSKQLELGLRHEFRSLVDTFNEGVTEKDQRVQSMKPEEEKKSREPPTLELIKSSTLRLSNGLRVMVKFGPMKSLSRLQQKGSPVKVLDYARVTVIFADPLLLALFYDELNSQFKLVRVHNKFVEKSQTEPPNVHINFEFQGHVCEAQLMLEDFVLIKEFSHKPYEIVRIAPKFKEGDDQKEFARKQREAMEHIIAEGVHCPHPGADCYPVCSHPILNTKLPCLFSESRKGTAGVLHGELPKITEEELTMEEVIGEDAFSIVWRAIWRRKLADEQRVAVKLPSSQFGRSLLARDLEVTSSLPHPNILTSYGVYKSPKGEILKIVYELMPTNLSKVLRQQSQSFPRRQPVLLLAMLLRVLRDVSAGLAHLHEHGVIHRDVKPSNVLLRDEQAKLCGFELSMDLQHTTQQMELAGTLDYMAPEVLNRQPVGRPSDVWSFGVLLFECVTGKVCARNTNMSELCDELKQMRCLPALVQLFVGCHENDPDERPSMRHIHTQLQMLVMQEARDSQRLKEELERAGAQDRDTYEMTWHYCYANQPQSQELLTYVKYVSELPPSSRMIARQPVTQHEGKGSMEEIERLANRASTRLHAHLKAIVEDCGGTYLCAPRKSNLRCVQKVQQDYNGDYSKLLDMERATGLFEQVEDMLRCLQQVRGADQPSLVRCLDRLNNPLESGYRDVLLNVRDEESGFVMELQLNFHKIAQLKSQAHRFFELTRVMELRY